MMLFLLCPEAKVSLSARRILYLMEFAPVVLYDTPSSNTVNVHDIPTEKMCVAVILKTCVLSWMLTGVHCPSGVDIDTAHVALAVFRTL